MHSLLRPKFFIPIHGEYRHLKRHARLAQELGMPASNILIPDIGTVAELTDRTLKQGTAFAGGSRLIDSSGTEDVASDEVLKDRVRMSEEGLLVIGLSVSRGTLLGDPVLTSKGFIFTGGDLKEISVVVLKAAESVPKGASAEEFANSVRRAVKNYIFKKTKKSPMIVPVINEL